MKFPEMVKTNARHRGPMEGRKQNNSMRDIRRSIDLAREQFTKRASESKQLMSDVSTEYNETIPNGRKDVVNGVFAVKGGEL
jgi:hypothetical protein